METKICTKCQLPKTDFNIGSNGKPKSWCKQCQYEYNKQWKKGKGKDSNNASMREISRKYRASLKPRLLAELGMTKCSHCPEECIACLDFHHTDDNKENCVSYLLGKARYNNALAEANKCIVLCANCHRKYHAGYIL